MSVITFDAIKYVDELIRSGFNEPQAKAQVKVLQGALDETTQNQLASKTDIFEVKTQMATKDNLRDIEIRLIKWMIAVNTATVGLLFAVFKLLG